MTMVFDSLAESPLLLLFAVIGIGSLVGSIRVAGFSLGPAGVLFTGIFLGSMDHRLRIPELVYVLGLVLFVYTIGIQSGPTFFASFGKRAFRANVFSFGAVLLAALLAAAGQRAFGLDGPTMVGVFCGSLTNTPALAASIEVIRQGAGAAADIQARISAPVVGYSVAYPFGVIGVLAGLFLFGKMRAARGRETPARDTG
jgi:putative transport protein